MEKLILAAGAGRATTDIAGDLINNLRAEGVKDVQFLDVDPDASNYAEAAISAVRNGLADAALWDGPDLPYTLPTGLSVEGVLGVSFASETRTVAAPAFEGLTLLVCPTDDRATVAALHAVSNIQAMKRFAVEYYLLHLLDPETAHDALVHADVYPSAGEEEHVSMALAYDGKEASRRCRIGNAKKTAQALKDVVFSHSANKGTVTIVGAGCGIGLLTLRGLHAVRKADVIVYDNYRDSDILAEAKTSCRTIYAGKEPGGDGDSASMNKILIQEAQQGCYVVALTTGDSFASGKGEDIIPSLQKAEIPYDVIPGVAPVLAYPELAGIPLVCRGLSHSYTIVSVDNLLKDDTDYDVLGSMQDTVVFRASLKNIRTVAARLIGGGRDAETPAALLSNCYEPGGKTIIGTLGSMARRTDTESTDAVLLVGDVVAYNFAATRTQLLTGLNVTVAGTRSYTHDLAGKLTELGAAVNVLPYLKVILKPGNVPVYYGAYSTIAFENGTSVDALVHCIRRRGDGPKLPADARLVAMSGSAAVQMRSYGLTPAYEFTENTPVEEILETLGGEPDSKLLLICSETGETTLAAPLRDAGALVDTAPIYRLSINHAVLDSYVCTSDYIVVSGGAGAAEFGSGTVDFGNATPVLVDTESADAFLDASDKFRYRRTIRSASADPEDVILALAENFN